MGHADLLIPYVERVGSREDVTSSNQTTQQPDGIIFSKTSVDKKTYDEG